MKQSSRKTLRKIFVIILSFILMTAGLSVGATQTEADEGNTDTKHSKYVYFISVSTGKVVQVNESTDLVADGEASMLEDVENMPNNALFYLVDSTDNRFEGFKSIRSVWNNQAVSARNVGEGGLRANGGQSTTGWEVMRFEAVEDGKYAIRTANGYSNDVSQGAYVKLDENNELIPGNTNIEEAEKFIIVFPDESSLPSETETESETPKEVVMPEGFSLLPHDWTTVGLTGAWSVYTGDWGNGYYANIGEKDDDTDPYKISLDFTDTSANEQNLVQLAVTFQNLQIGKTYQYVIKNGESELTSKVFIATSTEQKTDTLALGWTGKGTRMNLVATCEEYEEEKIDYKYLVAVGVNKVVQVDTGNTQLKADGDISLLEDLENLPANAKYYTVDGTDSRFEGYVAIRSAFNNNSVSGQGGGLQASSPGATTGWEIFKIVPQNDGTVALLSTNGDNYVSVDVNDNYKLKPSSKTISENEKFIFTSVEQPEEESYEITVDSSLVESVKKGDTYTLPEEAQYGYYCEGKMYKPGAEVTVNGAMAFTSVKELTVTMAIGAGIKTSVPAGLRFQATVASDNETALADQNVIKEGTLITANDIYENKGSGLTLSSDYTYLTVENIGWYNDRTGTYCGAIAQIAESNYIRDFVARAYVTVEYEDGTETTVYSDMSSVRSIQYVAKAVAAAGYPGLGDEEKGIIDGFAAAK